MVVHTSNSNIEAAVQASAGGIGSMQNGLYEPRTCRAPCVPDMRPYLRWMLLASLHPHTVLLQVYSVIMKAMMAPAGAARNPAASSPVAARPPGTQQALDLTERMFKACLQVQAFGRLKAYERLVCTAVVARLVFWHSP